LSWDAIRLQAGDRVEAVGRNTHSVKQAGKIAYLSPEQSELNDRCHHTMIFT